MKQLGRKILAINGGPHTNGTTAAMLGVAVDECRKVGDDVTEINLYDLKLEFCRGCRKCMETEECIFKNDDIMKLTMLIKECDMVILASPVYWANVPAAVKNMFDRLNGVAMEETKTFPKPRLAGKKYMILTACNTPMPFAKICGQSSGAIRAMVEFFKTAGMKKSGIIVQSNVINHPQISDKKAHKIRKKVVW